ncbi:hypothetical protein HanIR_Chr02g0083941 [Helianthus annuus]|nr:hypothetical protein HanIR_Chr02g0083941 [Helianthus annuus]
MVPVFGSVPGVSGCSWYLGLTRLSRSVSQTGQHRSNSMFGSGLVRGSHRNFVDVIRKHFISFVRIIALVRSLGFPIKEFSNATNDNRPRSFSWIPNQGILKRNQSSCEDGIHFSQLRVSMSFSP